MSHTKNILIYIAVFVAFLSTAPIAALAQSEEPDLTVSPVVIDEKAKARDILKKEIKITNTSNRKLTLYPSVNDVHPESGEEEFSAAEDSLDRAASLANWIELSRGVIDLGPGEEKIIPFGVRVNLNAVPGIYHAYISFAEGSTRAEAEKKAKLATVTVNLEVQADIKELMQLNKFITDNMFFSGDDVLFNYQLENIGNQELSPKGEIRIYNRKGEEVATVDVNEKREIVSPDQMKHLASVWSAANGFGKFKALLNVDYGNTQTASVQDTIFFWIVPWKQLLGLFVGSLIIVIFLALYFNRLFEERNLGRIAIAGAGMSLPGYGHVEMEDVREEEQEYHAPEPEPEVEQHQPASQKEKKKSVFSFFTGIKTRRANRKSSGVSDGKTNAAPITRNTPVHVEDSIPKRKVPRVGEGIRQIQRSSRKISGQKAAGHMGAYNPASAAAEFRLGNTGDTINLKNIRNNKPEIQGNEHGHVINLKKKG